MRDLAIQIDERLGRRAGLEQAVREAVRSGRLGAGTVLPSTRVLAGDLGYSRATVVAAYGQLCAEGYLCSAQGVGTMVAAVAVAQAASEYSEPARRPIRFDFRPGEPDTSSFPRQGWLGSMRRVLAEAPDAALGYPDPRGARELRLALAEYLGRARAVDASPAAVSVVAGFSAGVAHLGELFRHRGITEVAVEDPTLFLVPDLLRLAGVRPVPIPLDGEGIRVDLLEASAVQAVIVTPAHQYPLGMTMTPRRRGALIEWAHRTESWIVEDDYDGEFRYGRQPIGSLQGLNPDRVIYAGTASKSLVPGLRLGWLVVPDVLRRDLLRVKHLRSATSVLDQLALADFITSGAFDRHLRSMRAVYRARRSLLVEAVAPVVPGIEQIADPAGLHVTVPLPAASDEGNLVAEAADEGIGLLSLSSHCLEARLGPGLVVGFTRPASHEFRQALDQLVRFFRRAL